MSFPHDHGKCAERAASESAIRCDLQQAIGDCSIPPDMFVSRESLEQIWSQARVDEFIRPLDPTVHPSHVPLIRCKFLQTISILAYMQWDNWSRFNEIFLSHTDGCGRQDRTDGNIPEYTLETLKSSTFLGPAAGIKFFYDRYIFCPIDIVVGTSIVRSEEWRLPFLRDKSAGLGRREYGHTTREMIPGSHMFVSKGVCSPTAVVVAQKVFASKKPSRRETWSLNMIRDILSRHDRVALHLAIITIGNDVHILTPMADMNLEKFLLFQLHQYEITELLQEAANLANALDYLHNRLQAGDQVYFYHRDLKPSKILIYSISPSSEYHRVGRWKITDFDLSVVKKPEGHLPVRGFVTRTTNQQSWIPGPYQAPEVCVNDGADFRSNIWSFGCILVRLLSSKLDGPGGLMWLDELRCKDVDKVSAYEHDYFYRGDPPNLNPHIKEWINNLPRRTGGYNEEFLSCCRDFLLSTLKVDKYERSSAESVARQLQQLTKLLMPPPGPLFDPEVYSNDSVYDGPSRHLLHTSGISGQVVTEDPTFCGYIPGPQPVTGSKSASECCPHNPKHKAHVTQPADRWDWVEKLQTFGYSIQEINDILLERARDAPWIYFESEKFHLPLMSTTQHIARCCHSLGERRQQGSTSDSMDTLQRGIDLEVDSYKTVKEVEELCGLCGISPKTRVPTDWLGSASFTEGNTAMAVTYSLSTDKCHEAGASTIIGRISGALQGFQDAAGLLQSRGLCCDSFTVIRHGGWHSEVDGVAAGEVVSLGFHLVANLAQALEQSMGTNTPSPRQILSASSAILTLISPEFEVAHDRSDMAVSLHLGALAVQFLCLGFMSYVQAHIGPIEPFFLDTPISRVVLLGLDEDNKYPNLVAKLVDITCLGDMTRGPVWMFFRHRHSEENQEFKRSCEPASERCVIMGQMCDILDTWGPGNVIYRGDEMRCPIAVQIGGGFIFSDDGLKCHWAREIKESTILRDLDPRGVLRIGALVSENDSCRLDEETCRNESVNVLEYLGTSTTSWVRSQRQIGVQGGQHGVCQYSEMWNKQRGISIKEAALTRTNEELLQYMTESWGVQVSYCTGVARRVLLRTTVAHLLRIFLNSFDQHIHEFERQLRESSRSVQAIHSWIKGLPQKSSQQILGIIRTILNTLKPTGLDPTGKYLCVAWPFEGDTTRCLKVPLGGRNSWAKILEDSHDTATFAYITMECLEAKHVECKGAREVRHEDICLLETTVTSAVRDRPGPWSLKHEGVYFFAKLDSSFWVKVQREHKNGPASLVELMPLENLSHDLRQWFRSQEKKQQGRLRECPKARDESETVYVYSVRRNH